MCDVASVTRTRGARGAAAGNSIGDAGAAAIAEALKVNKTVTEIDLRCACRAAGGALVLSRDCHVTARPRATVNGISDAVLESIEAVLWSESSARMAAAAAAAAEAKAAAVVEAAASMVCPPRPWPHRPRSGIHVTFRVCPCVCVSALSACVRVRVAVVCESVPPTPKAVYLYFA